MVQDYRLVGGVVKNYDEFTKEDLFTKDDFPSKDVYAITIALDFGMRLVNTIWMSTQRFIGECVDAGIFQE